MDKRPLHTQATLMDTITMLTLRTTTNQVHIGLRGIHIRMFLNNTRVPQNHTSTPTPVNIAQIALNDNRHSLTWLLIPRTERLLHKNPIIQQRERRESAKWYVSIQCDIYGSSFYHRARLAMNFPGCFTVPPRLRDQKKFHSLLLGECYHNRSK